MTTLLRAEQWLTEKAQEGNPYAQVIREEMDKLRLQNETAWKVTDATIDKSIADGSKVTALEIELMNSRQECSPERLVTGQVDGKPFRGYVVEVME